MFMKGLDDTYKLAMTQMVVLGSSFQSIIDHAKMIESIIQDTQKGTKRVCHHNYLIGHKSQGIDFSIEGSRGYHGRTVQATLWGLGGRP